MAQRGLLFVWDDPAVSVVLSGMSTLDQVKENVRSADSAIAGRFRISSALFMQKPEGYWNRTVVPCTGCEYCLPCPAGVNIPPI
jgi:predicted aldo/keto reductase-like oxidoreductase